jgi:hypothetical protein
MQLEISSGPVPESGDYSSNKSMRCGGIWEIGDTIELRCQSGQPPIARAIFCIIVELPTTSNSVGKCKEDDGNLVIFQSENVFSVRYRDDC